MSPAGQSPDVPMPMVTRRDIEDMRDVHGGHEQGHIPYPQSMASMNVNTRHQPRANVGTNMPPLPDRRTKPGRDGGSGDSDGGFI